MSCCFISHHLQSLWKHPAGGFRGWVDRKETRRVYSPRQTCPHLQSLKPLACIHAWRDCFTGEPNSLQGEAKRKWTQGKKNEEMLNLDGTGVYTRRIKALFCEFFYCREQRFSSFLEVMDKNKPKTMEGTPKRGAALAWRRWRLCDPSLTQTSCGDYELRWGWGGSWEEMIHKLGKFPSKWHNHLALVHRNTPCCQIWWSSTHITEQHGVLKETSWGKWTLRREEIVKSPKCPFKGRAGWMLLAHSGARISQLGQHKSGYRDTERPSFRSATGQSRDFWFLIACGFRSNRFVALFYDKS